MEKGGVPIFKPVGVWNWCDWPFLAAFIPTMQILYVAESLIQLYQQREQVRGLRLVYAAPVLRHFTARLEEIS
ncbi:MAG: hypothetical protein HY652_03065 [Acidobacteria bacterium]|nr:hypothetical protein [Acidobacteriota bacterium]